MGSESNDADGSAVCTLLWRLSPTQNLLQNAERLVNPSTLEHLDCNQSGGGLG
jgi:hypothetical protein